MQAFFRVSTLTPTKRPSASSRTAAPTVAVALACRRLQHRRFEARRGGGGGREKVATAVDLRLGLGRGRLSDGDRGVRFVTSAGASGEGSPGGGGPGGGNDDDKGDESAMSGLARRLAERRYDPEGAQKVLETFDKLGIENEEQLQRFFAEVSLPQLGGQVGQIVVVGLSAWAALYVQSAVANDPDIGFPLSGLLYFGLGVTGLTLSLECITNSLLLAAAVSTTVIWGLNPKAFLSAVRSSAGELANTGLGAVDRAAELAKAVDVAQSMLELQGALGDKLKNANANADSVSTAGAATPSGSTLDRLGAMLTLSKAKDVYGFDAARVGLTAEEANDLASTFARFDVTGSGKLNSGDLYDLARELGISLSVEDSEVRSRGGAERQEPVFYCFQASFLPA